MPESGDVVNLDENCFADSQVKMIFCYTMEQYLSAEMQLEQASGADDMEVKLLSKSREGYYYAENKDGGDAVLITAPQDAESYDGTLTAMDGSAVTITSIGDGAFANCQSLKWVTLPESVDTIGYQAFVNCSGLQGVLIDTKERIVIGNRAWDGCGALRFVASNAMEGIMQDDYNPDISDSNANALSSSRYFFVPTNAEGYASNGIQFTEESGVAGFCVALPYKDGLSVNEIGSMREFQKIQMEWLGMPVQMNAGRGMDYFVLQHMEEHFTRLIIISAGRYSKDIVSLAQRIGVTVLSIVEDAGSTAGIVCSMLAHRLKDKYQLSVLILLAPWSAAFVLTGFRGCFEGLKAWINLMITQWNKVHEDSIALLSGNIVQHDLWASTVVIALLCGEVTYFLITLRKYGFCALYCILWVMVQLFSSAFSPAACIGLFVPVVAVYISNQRTEMNHRGLLWVAGLTAVLVICAVAVPQEDMLSMAKAKSALKLSLSNMRYGQPTLPEGHVDEADQLKANENEMFTVTSEQKKSLSQRLFRRTIYRRVLETFVQCRL